MEVEMYPSFISEGLHIGFHFHPPHTLQGKWVLGVCMTTVQQSIIKGDVHLTTVNKKESNKFKSITIGSVSQTFSALTSECQKHDMHSGL
jgi:hypothetical protein